MPGKMMLDPIGFGLDGQDDPSWTGKSPSARRILVTLLSLFVYPDPRPCPSLAFIEALGLLGYDAGTARMALSRARGAKWLESQRDGRRTLWTLSETGRTLLTAGRQRLVTLEKPPYDWDRRLLVLHASVPEDRRSVRYVLQNRLSWLGFGRLSPGTWISFRVEAEPDVAALLNDLDLPDGILFIATPGLAGDMTRMAHRAWDLEGLANRYKSFVKEYAETTVYGGDDALVVYSRMVTDWRAFPFLDPTLPREIAPADWPGREAIHLYRDLSRTLRKPALARWDDFIRAAR